MATSPIYNWPEPDNTDLVKNGALAMRTLGDAIDTTMATMTPKSIVDAKGDLIAASAADTPARLAVGANGETLVADSSTSTGLRYTAGVAQSNPVLNSAFEVWQRGTSFSIAASAATTYTADRWTYGSVAYTSTISRQLTGDTTNLPFIQYCARVQRNSGETNTSASFLVQGVETANTIPYAGKTVTVSFYARQGANYSATSDILTMYLQTGTGTDQNPQNPYTGQATASQQNVTLTSTWQRFTLTPFAIASNTTEMKFILGRGASGTAGAADFYEFTGVQIDIGSVALPFRTNGGSIQGELALCQRYYVRQGGDSNFQPYGVGIANSGGTQVQAYVTHPVTMRTAPTSIDFSTLGVTDSVSTTAATGVTLGNAGKSMSAINLTFGSTVTGWRTYTAVSNSSTSAYLGFSAEL